MKDCKSCRKIDKLAYDCFSESMKVFMCSNLKNDECAEPGMNEKSLFIQSSKALHFPLEIEYENRLASR